MNNCGTESEKARGSCADSNSSCLAKSDQVSLNEEGRAKAGPNGAAAFDILPATALELLCIGIDLLARASVSKSVDLAAVGSAQRDSTSSGDGTPAMIAELHCSPAGNDDDGQDRVQQSILSKRFLSKREPPISLKDYLLRLHRYCPMSTAVYLATSIYITRMVTVDRVISVNPKNMHRLALAGLRVAMKALEDLSYPHGRVAKVGGVSERELTRLEISFCFLADFELRVDAQMMTDQARSLQNSMDLAPTET